MLTDGRRTTDAAVIGILIAHLGAFGSGELKSVAPDQLASQKSADQDLHCFQNRKHRI